VLNGQKKWIGNSTFSEINIIWARDEASGQVKGFVVEKDNLLTPVRRRCVSERHVLAAIFPHLCRINLRL
jgi:alkylation response protein AidB-like acyl-CoA dehydrogenase